MEKIIVFGAGGHAKAVIDVIEKAGLYEIIGILDSYKAPGSMIYGYEVLGDEQVVFNLGSQIYGGIIAIGDNWRRSQLVDHMTSLHPEFNFISAVHPSATLAKGTVIGQGCVIMAGAIIGSDTNIGDHCILYSQASVDHDSTLGNFVTFAPHTATGGNVHIGDYSVISIGANIIHSTVIGEHTVIGAGSTVLTDISGYCVAYGTPARIVRARQLGERYL
ncbi:acetyltransferase [Paenibacillus wynnii]|uniref:acetyltransferase n=1 Tax=Paenibacillus wynnii TaxID=268407 RepID=UPI0027946736|nr:acetyltransferase [Paenibacillus wynnii]MDQ0194113.1 sugar O-acyltransferase (sialic acid O-acetyltransferase NeuD family) [Paenibacillus wynnii]